MEESKKNQSMNALLHDRFWAQYQSKTDLVGSIKEDDDFYNGRQWGEYDPADGFPRVTVNIIKKGVDLIASKVNGTPLYLSYSAFGKNGEGKDCTRLTQFDEFVLKDLEDTTFGWQSCVNADVRGTEITYVRWDADDETIKGLYKGGLAYEHIDPRCFAVANPQLPSIQKQAWVMFWSDVPLGACKKMVDEEKDLSDQEKKRRKGFLVRDDTSKKDDILLYKDSMNGSLIRVYTRFFRINGEVCYMCSTQTTDLFAYPKPLSTLVPEDYAKKAQEAYERKLGDQNSWKNAEGYEGELMPDLEIDYEDVAIGDYGRKANSDDEHRRLKEKFSMYPFAVYTSKPISNSIFGFSMTKALIPAQKALNYCYSMVVQCAQNNAFSKIFAKDGALGNQEITNEPGQIITDYSNDVNGWGIKLAESQPLPNDLTAFGGNFMDIIAKTYGFSDVMSGEIANQDLSGYAVQQMVKQNNTPIEQQQQLFWKYKKDLAKIRIMFYKHYVDEAYYSWDYTDGEVELNEKSRRTLIAGSAQGLPIQHPDGTDYTTDELEMLQKPVEKTHFSSIKGRELWGNDYVISIDAQQGLVDSKLTEEQAFDNLIMNGGVANMDADTFEFVIKCDPAFSPKTRASMLTYARIKREGEIAQYQQQIAQLQQQLEAMQSQLGFQSNYNKNLQAEFESKIKAANRYTKNVTDENSALKAQAMQAQSQRNSQNGRSLGADGTTMTVADVAKQQS